MRAVAVAGAVGVVAYVTSWALAGAWTPGYDPARQAISELFASGAPTVPATLVRASLLVTGIVLVPLALVLHRGLPGVGVAGPVLAAIAGVATALIVAFPCTHGCPGWGTSFTDTMHTVVAGTGYAGLVAAPLFFALRLRGHDDRLAAVSLVLGAVASAGFVLRALGVADATSGIQQRVFNTAADAWYVVAAVAVLRR